MANEKRLIDANAFWNRLNNTVYDLFDPESDFGYSPGIIKAVLDQTKTVDAVEVVRCKDCKWYKEGELLAPNKFCFRLKHPTEDRNVGYNFCDDDFCSYGERKDNEKL